jgi:hypothetical protein
LGSSEARERHGAVLALSAARQRFAADEEPVA